jgi:osmotically-inducible protein OsmY
MIQLIKHITKLGAAVLVIQLVAALTARAQYVAGGFPANGNSFDGISASATNGSFGTRNLGGMMNSSPGSGSFGQRDFGGMMNSVTTTGSFGQHTMGPMMNSARGAGTFTGSAEATSGFAGGTSYTGNLNSMLQPTVANTQMPALQYSAGQYDDAVSFLSNMVGRNSNRDRPRVTSSEDPSAVASKLSAELSQLSGSYGPIRVQIKGQTAVLRGTVATEHDRDRAGRLAMLERTVSHVQNELQVAADTTPQPENSPAGAATARQSATSQR